MIASNVEVPCSKTLVWKEKVTTCVYLSRTKNFCSSHFSRPSIFSRLLKFYMPSGSLLLLSSHNIFKAYKWTFLLNKVFHIYLQSQLRRRGMTFSFVLGFYATKFHRFHAGRCLVHSRQTGPPLSEVSYSPKFLEICIASKRNQRDNRDLFLELFIHDW